MPQIGRDVSFCNVSLNTGDHEYCNHKSDIDVALDYGLSGCGFEYHNRFHIQCYIHGTKMVFQTDDNRQNAKLICWSYYIESKRLQINKIIMLNSNWQRKMWSS